MSIKMNYNTEKLWNGCILAGIAHAIMVAHYPLLDYEHSWDGFNYSVQDGMGQRGTISFGPNCCTGAFRNENSNRIVQTVDAYKYFAGASEEVLNFAETETLQYLLDDVDGRVEPVITTGFWGDSELYSNDTIEEMMENGLDLIKYHLLDFDYSVEWWNDYYEMNSRQVDLLKSLYKRRIESTDSFITLTAEEKNMIGNVDEKGRYESEISFAELKIQWV